MASKTETVGPSQSYQRFAWITLALAGTVALFSADRAEPGAAMSLPPAPFAAAAPIPARMAQAPAAPLAEANSGDEANQVIGETAEDQAATPEAPGAEPALGDAGAKVPGAGPSSAAEAGQLMSSSRNRSGGISQGDEPIRGPAQ